MQVKTDLMFVSLSFNLPRQSRKVKAQADIDERRLKASAKLYSGEAFGAIKSYDNATRNTLLTMAIRVPSMFKGAYVLPAAMVDDVRRLLNDRALERDTLVVDFINNEYDREREAAREALNGSFRESDFPAPSELRNYFSMKYSLFTLEVPKGLPDDIRESEIQKYKDNMTNVFVECRDALRNTLSELVGHLAERLQPDADGKRKRLTRTTVENLRDFLDTVNKRDITSDDDILRISDQAREILKNYSADDLKGQWTGERVQAGLEIVKTEIDGLIRRDGGRKIDLDLE